MTPKKQKTTLHRSCKNKKLKEETKPNAHLVGFARGLEPKKILGATNNHGEVKYLIKWKGTKNNDLVTAEEVKQCCPQLLISFFEQRIQWIDDIDTSGIETAGGETAAQPEPKSVVGETAAQPQPQPKSVVGETAAQPQPEPKSVVGETAAQPQPDPKSEVGSGIKDAASS
ncbi:chromobox protein homolog 1 [Drosophila madeirensis]|uniref:Chromobox protein homolog 1 n=1 Tax=Drosophila madeirensis TaxID=30013 RepID=A0AAU9F9E2_DROMD